jgi:hypothetical protein
VWGHRVEPQCRFGDRRDAVGIDSGDSRVRDDQKWSRHAVGRLLQRHSRRKVGFRNACGCHKLDKRVIAGPEE